LFKLLLAHFLSFFYNRKERSRKLFFRLSVDVSDVDCTKNYVFAARVEVVMAILFGVVTAGTVSIHYNMRHL